MSMGGSQESSTSVPQFVTEGGQFGVDRSKELSQIGYMPWYGPDVAGLAPLQQAAMQNTAQAANAFGMQTPGGGGGSQGQGFQPGTQGGIMGDPLAEVTGNYRQATVPDTEKAQRIQRAYTEQLGRTPDEAGFQFWMQNFDPDNFEQQFSQGTRVDPLTGLPAAGNFGGISGYSSAPMFEQGLNQLQQRRPGQFQRYTDMFVDPISGRMAGEQQQQDNGLGGFGEDDRGLLDRLLERERRNRDGK